MAQQGTGVGRSQEHLLQARYVNMQHDVMNMSLATAVFQGASFERLGKLVSTFC
jgi:anaphase-promoting complex subunit 5